MYSRERVRSQAKNVVERAKVEKVRQVRRREEVCAEVVNLS